MARFNNEAAVAPRARVIVAEFREPDRAPEVRARVAGEERDSEGGNPPRGAIPAPENARRAWRNRTRAPPRRRKRRRQNRTPDVLRKIRCDICHRGRRPELSAVFCESDDTKNSLKGAINRDLRRDRRLSLTPAILPPAAFSQNINTGLIYRDELIARPSSD